jgi:hypothetical protein
MQTKKEHLKMIGKHGLEQGRLYLAENKKVYFVNEIRNRFGQKEFRATMKANTNKGFIERTWDKDGNNTNNYLYEYKLIAIPSHKVLLQERDS